MLKSEVVRMPQRLQEISRDWHQLADRTGNVSPFQLPEWQLTWWRHFGGGQLRSFAFWGDGQLAGLVPLFLHEWQGRRQLTLLGSGVTDYLEPCVSNAEVYDLLSTELQNDPDWEVCDWQDLAADTRLRSLRGLRVVEHTDTPCSAIALSGSFDEYWRARSGDLRRNIKRYARKAEAEAALHFSVAERPQPEVLKALIDLHGERWQRRGEAGMVEANHSGDFLLDVAALDNCRSFSLEWKGGIVAATVGFVRDRKVYSYLSAFDPAFEILGFGRNLLYRSLQWACEQGFSAWDFLRGDEPYKASWGAVQTAKCWVLITRS